MGPIWGREDPGGPRVGPMNIAIWEVCEAIRSECLFQFQLSKISQALNNPDKITLDANGKNVEYSHRFHL